MIKFAISIESILSCGNVIRPLQRIWGNVLHSSEKKSLREKIWLLTDHIQACLDHKPSYEIISPHWYCYWPPSTGNSNPVLSGIKCYRDGKKEESMFAHVGVSRSVRLSVCLSVYVSVCDLQTRIRETWYKRRWEKETLSFVAMQLRNLALALAPDLLLLAWCLALK